MCALFRGILYCIIFDYFDFVSEYLDIDKKEQQIQAHFTDNTKHKKI